MARLGNSDAKPGSKRDFPAPPRSKEHDVFRLPDKTKNAQFPYQAQASERLAAFAPRESAGFGQAVLTDNVRYLANGQRKLS